MADDPIFLNVKELYHGGNRTRRIRRRKWTRGIGSVPESGKVEGDTAVVER
jgi:hypothetical protein